MHQAERDARFRSAAVVSACADRVAAPDEVQRSEDELVVLLLMRASAMQQKCRHADSSRARVPQWNDTEREHRRRDGFCFGLPHDVRGKALTASEVPVTPQRQKRCAHCC